MRKIIQLVLAIIFSAAAYAQNEKAGSTRINPLDGAEMIYIPEGEFTMGSDDGQKDERPVHKVDLDGYWIYKYEVTVGQYRKFCSKTGRSMPEPPHWGWNENHPIVNVRWHDAMAYAKWAGGSLPTEAQWEKAARGTDGRKYPWGNDWDSGKCNCLGEIGKTTAAGHYASVLSPYGCHDMAGNVWEWCADWYDEGYYRHSSKRNPDGPKSGVFRVLRGGAWNYDGSDYRCANRNRLEPAHGSWFYPNLGFRVVQPR